MYFCNVLKWTILQIFTVVAYVYILPPLFNTFYSVQGKHEFLSNNFGQVVLLVRSPLWNELTVEVLEPAVTQAPQLSGQWDSLASCSCLSLRFRFSLIVKPLGGQSLKGVYGTPSDATRPLHTICHWLNACLLPPSARVCVCVCAHCPGSKLN